MKRTLGLAAAALTFAGAAHAQGVDPDQYRLWVQQQNLQRSVRMNDPIYRSYAGVNRVPPRMPQVPGNQSPSRSYYRGPAGEMVTAGQLPPGGFGNGYTYAGSYGATHKAKTPTPRKKKTR